MKFYLLNVLAALSVAVATPSVLADTYKKDRTDYVGGSVGNGFQTDDTDMRSNSFNYEAHYGQDYGWSRLEVGAFRKETSGESALGDYEITGVNIAGYLPWRNSSNLTPYVVGGVGVAQFNGSAFASDETNAIYFVGLGTELQVSDSVNLDFQYRYTGSPVDVRQNDGSFDGYREHAVMVGFNIKTN